MCLLLSLLTLLLNPFCCLSARVFFFCFRFLFFAYIYDFVFVSSFLLHFMFFTVFNPVYPCSAPLCFCYPSLCLQYHLRYLLTRLIVLIIGNFFDFSVFILVKFYIYYGMIGCMTCVSVTTCVDVLLNLIEYVFFCIVLI